MNDDTKCTTVQDRAQQSARWPVALSAHPETCSAQLSAAWWLLLQRGCKANTQPREYSRPSSHQKKRTSLILCSLTIAYPHAFQWSYSPCIPVGVGGKSDPMCFTVVRYECRNSAKSFLLQGKAEFSKLSFWRPRATVEMTRMDLQLLTYHRPGLISDFRSSLSILSLFLCKSVSSDMWEIGFRAHNS